MTGSFDIIEGDCLEELAKLPADSVDAGVTDPPYELGFMGKKWDGSGIAFSPAMWAELLRVLKPGAHLVSFSGTRTYHRMVCAIEDAGFEIRDQIAWTYGSGFPKSSNQKGEWEGWGTALKPAWEPIVLARKPLIGTVPENLAAHRTGALNIDGCRIEGAKGSGNWKGVGGQAGKLYEGGFEKTAPSEQAAGGRWPANLCHDGSPEVLAEFPSEAGAAAPVTVRNGDKFRGTYGAFKGNRDEEGSTFKGDSGSAARFFYCSKASSADREAGLEFAGVTESLFGMSGGAAAAAAARGEEYDNKDGGVNKTTRRRNIHPTVKPTDLMRWLCRLVTPPNGTVVDPFLGSGSTGRAAVLEGFRFIGIEKEAAYIPIARARISEAVGELFAQ